MSTAIPIKKIDILATARNSVQGEEYSMPWFPAPAPIGTNIDKSPNEAESESNPAFGVPIIDANPDVMEAFASGEQAAARTPVDLTVEMSIEFPINIPYLEYQSNLAADIESRIDGLAMLPKNHDGDGALRVTSEAIEAAKLIVSNLHGIYGVTCDEVGPLADGGVEIEAECGQTYFSIWVLDGSTVQYVVKRGELTTKRSGTVSEIPEFIWAALA